MTVHVAICKENEVYAAQCLEHDVCAQGDTREQALERFRLTLMGEIALEKHYRGKTENFLATFPPAPLFYWRNFKDVELVTVDETQVRLISQGQHSNE